MKYLLLIILLALMFFVLGFKRARPAAPPAEKKKPGPATPQDMLSCAHCGLHLPRDEALPGMGGVFCSAAHRSQYEAEHGGPR